MLSQLVPDCIYCISSFLDLPSFSHFLVVDSQIFQILTDGPVAKVAWLSQFTMYQKGEIALLMTSNKKKHKHAIKKLKREIENQRILLERFERRKKKKTDDEVINSFQSTDEYTMYSVYNSFRQFVYACTINSLNKQLKIMAKRLKTLHKIEDILSQFDKMFELTKRLDHFRNMSNKDAIIKQKLVALRTAFGSGIGRGAFFTSIEFLIRKMDRSDIILTEEQVDSILNRLELIVENGLIATVIEKEYLLLFAVGTRSLRIIDYAIQYCNRYEQVLHTLAYENRTKPIAYAIVHRFPKEIINRLLYNLKLPNKPKLVSELFNISAAYSLISYDLGFLEKIVEDFEADVTKVEKIDFFNLIEGEGDGLKKLDYFLEKGWRRTWEANAYAHPVFAVINAVKYKDLPPITAIGYLERLINLGVDLSCFHVFEDFTPVQFPDELFNYLISNGGLIDSVNAEGMTPLLEAFHFLCSHSNFLHPPALHNIEKLLKAGANPRRFFKMDNTYYSCLRLLFPYINFHEKPTSACVTAFEVLAEYGVTPDTEEPDPDGITFHEWFKALLMSQS